MKERDIYIYYTLHYIHKYLGNNNIDDINISLNWLKWETKKQELLLYIKFERFTFADILMRKLINWMNHEDEVNKKNKQTNRNKIITSRILNLYIYI